VLIDGCFDVLCLALSPSSLALLRGAAFLRIALTRGNTANLNDFLSRQTSKIRPRPWLRLRYRLHFLLLNNAQFSTAEFVSATRSPCKTLRGIRRESRQHLRLLYSVLHHPSTVCGHPEDAEAIPEVTNLGIQLSSSKASDGYVMCGSASHKDTIRSSVDQSSNAIASRLI
jgi:hypothetical protein